MQIQVYDTLATGRQPRASRIAVLIVCAVGLLCAPPARAQVPDPPSTPSASPAAREAARALGREGLALFDAGRFEAALQRFEQAYAVYPAPTLGLHAARCLVQLRQLARAAAVYRDVSRRAPEPDEPPAFAEARAHAAAELRAIEPRVPRLVIELEPASSEPAIVTIDGRVISSSMSTMELDPGTHRVEARRGELSVARTFDIAEGQTVRLSLRLEPRDQPRARQEGASSPLWTAGVVAAGVGAAGLIVWGTTGALAISERSKLDDAGCVDGSCPRALQDDVDTYNALRVASAVGFMVGATGLAAGTALLIAAPSERSPSAVRAFVGPGSVGVAGRF